MHQQLTLNLGSTFSQPIWWEQLDKIHFSLVALTGSMSFRLVYDAPHEFGFKMRLIWHIKYRIKHTQMWTRINTILIYAYPENIKYRARTGASYFVSGRKYVPSRIVLKCNWSRHYLNPSHSLNPQSWEFFPDITDHYRTQ